MNLHYSSVRCQPQRLLEWTDVAMQLAKLNDNGVTEWKII
jgi:hypothetical protein